MATDRTEPPIGRIIVLAGLSLGTLLALQYLFHSYFTIMYERDQRAKVFEAPTDQLDHARAREAQALARLEPALRTVASGGRPRAIAPEPSTTYDPMVGWSLLHRDFTPPAPPAPPAPPPAEVAPPAAAAPTPTATGLRGAVRPLLGRPSPPAVPGVQIHLPARGAPAPAARPAAASRPPPGTNP
ncbi:MAG: hypothetical protein HY909_01540 [Deltaproteobacteria bacterium]|nr:hypothetical protein [Deltaproteobacteria bacterium]